MNNAEYQYFLGVSSHWLIDMLESPAHCWRRHLDANRIPSESSDAMRLGTLVHMLILSPEKFDEEIEVMRCGRRTLQERLRWNCAISEGKTPVTPAELELARNITAAVQAHERARALLHRGAREVEIFRERPGLLPLKGRMDVFDEAAGLVVELKTCYRLDAIEAAMTRFRYPLSAAYYQHLTGATQTAFVFVEKNPPFAIETFFMEQTVIDKGEDQWRAALARFDDCWLRDDWPEADEDDLAMPAFRGRADRMRPFRSEQLEL